MPDWKNISAIEALRLAKDATSLTDEELARRMGISAHVVRRYFRQQDGYMPGLDKIAPLCEALGNRIILNWLEAQIERERVDAPPARSRAQVLTAVTRAAACMGDVQRVLADSEESGIDPEMARELRSQLKEVMDQCQHCRAMLNDTAKARDWRDGGVLASIGKPATGERRWWEIWKW